MNEETTEVKKLIEVALPLDKLNENFKYEKSVQRGPKGIHQWWARRPFTTARAVIWASIVDDPSSHPREFPTPESQERERDFLISLRSCLTGRNQMTQK